MTISNPHLNNVNQKKSLSNDSEFYKNLDFDQACNDFVNKFSTCQSRSDDDSDLTGEN